MKPEEKAKQLDIIRRQLGLSEAGEELGDLFDGLLASALMHSNRTSTPDALLKLVRDAVCAAWRRRCEYSCRMRNPERQGLKDLKRLEMA